MSPAKVIIEEYEEQNSGISKKSTPDWSKRKMDLQSPEDVNERQVAVDFQEGPFNVPEQFGNVEVSSIHESLDALVEQLLPPINNDYELLSQE